MTCEMCHNVITGEISMIENVSCYDTNSHQTKDKIDKGNK